MSSDVERLRRDVSLSSTVASYGYRLQRNGREYQTCCPFHAENTASFTIYAGQDGVERFHCFGCGEHGDVLDFVRKLKGVSLPEAMRLLGSGDCSHHHISRAETPATDAYDGIVPVTPPVEPLLPGRRVRLYNPKRRGKRAEWGAFAPSMVFPYRHRDGSLMGYVLRHDLPGGTKETPMVMFVRLEDGTQTWCRFPFPKPRPLYGLQELPDSGKVIVVEGEKCRDSLRKATGHSVVSWAGGTQGAKHTDWSPLAGRDILIWPDFDVSGLSTSSDIAQRLTALAAKVQLVGFTETDKASQAEVFSYADWQAGNLPSRGWDCADAVDAGWTKARLQTFMRQTIRPYLPPAPPDSKPAATAVTPSAPGKSSTGKSAITTQGKPRGVDGIEDMPEHFPPQSYGSEVWLAREFQQALKQACGGDIVRAEGKFWAFGPSAWRPIPDQKIRLAVHALDAVAIGAKATPLKLGKRMIDGILNELGTRVCDDDFFKNPVVGMNAKNCTITIDDSGKVTCRDHDPQDRFRFTIDAEYHLHTDSKPPDGSLLHRLLSGAFKGDVDADSKIHLISEMLGAAAFGLATRVKQPKAFILLGETASNGKSTIAALFRALLPEGAVSSISPAFFNDEKRIINLAGKAANVADELSAAAIAGEEFKAAVTGNPIEGRSLYKNVVSFSPRALHCFTTNTLPRFNGGIDRGLRRRLVVMQFNRTIPESEVITDIAERIQAEELDLLLGFAVAGAIRLKKNGGYSIPESSKDALNSWLLLDPLNEWFDIRVVPAPFEPQGGWLRTSRLFEDFKTWAVDQGYKESFLPPVNTFSQRLKSMPNIQLKRLSTGMVAQGVTIQGGTQYGQVF
ncbi:hypothetical protein IB237_23960 [Agrobacterium sp. AGB01]|uniref:CHC2 zinc finger domain-containing protein n=1 Tax=Agrobacterium sp. AGB01 TaxID=2769302 RepID=UPI0017850298|nr:CHC2 zinc finger domain-containing protein [Agrobacterium sp. AGB01]MBD9390260.1 hypothetical protein [Agrobacterium sp. AGB01]